MAAEDYMTQDPFDEQPEEYGEICYKEITHETDKAMLFDTEDGKVWLPKTAIDVHEKEKTVSIEPWVTWKYI
jgi:hypothetical protein